MSHLDREHGDALWAVDAVPDAEVPPVLRHHHVAAGHPLDIRAEAQQRGLHATLYVVQLELGGETDTGVHCCLHQPPLKSGNQRANLRMPQQPENSAVSLDSASVHFAELQLLPEDPPLLQSAVFTPLTTTSRITTSIFNKAPPSIVLPWSSAGKVFNKDRPVDGGKFQFERHL